MPLLSFAPYAPSNPCPRIFADAATHPGPPFETQPSRLLASDCHPPAYLRSVRVLFSPIKISPFDSPLYRKTLLAAFPPMEQGTEQISAIMASVLGLFDAGVSSPTYTIKYSAWLRNFVCTEDELLLTDGTACGMSGRTSPVGSTPYQVDGVTLCFGF
jgi:hypothetical protein